MTHYLSMGDLPFNFYFTNETFSIIDLVTELLEKIATFVLRNKITCQPETQKELLNETQGQYFSSKQLYNKKRNLKLL